MSVRLLRPRSDPRDRSTARWGVARITAGTAAIAAVSVGIAGCGLTESTKSAKGTDKVDISITDDGCSPSPASIKAGKLTFKVTNKDAKRVTEAELLKDGRILGEKENLTPGLNGEFTLRLDAGKYSVLCPNAKEDSADFEVTGKSNPDDANADASLKTAVTSYTLFVQNQAGTLVANTKRFTDAIKAGNIAQAKELYAPARTYYEKIEPVAESFGNLDPDIDARVNDVENVATWTGFHRLEKALWQDKSLAGMTPIATKLMTDVTKLQTLTKTVKLQPAQIANGAVDLLGEVSKSKITGEEDRYSHTDLWDFDANLAGAREAFDVLQPALGKKNAALATKIGTQFTTVHTDLAKYQQGAGYVDYSKVTAAERRNLAVGVNALAESLSKVAPLIG